MKKTGLLMLMVLLLACTVYGASSTTLKGYNLSQDNLVLTLSYSVPPAPYIKYIADKNLIYIELPDTQLSSSLIKPTMIQTQYIKKIDMMNGFDNNVTIFIYLNPNVKYKYILDSKLKQFTFSFTKSVPITPQKRITIVIDPGHGGKDPGAVGIGGIHEKDIVYNIAMDLRQILQQNNFNVILTRSSDTFIPLPNRSNIANKENADFFISIHANATAAKSELMRGVEAFYFSKTPSQYAQTIAAYENSVDQKFGIQDTYTDLIVNDIFYQINQDKSAEMASLITSDIASDTGEQNRGIYGANFAVLRGSKMPAVLVEVGFLTNSIEGKKLMNATYQYSIARGIADAIVKYYNT